MPRRKRPNLQTKKIKKGKSIHSIDQKTLDKQTLDQAFVGLKFTSKLSGGKQKKAKYTGFFVGDGTRHSQYAVDKAYALKKSLDYPADNMAEAVSSSLLVDFIGPQHALAYRLTQSKDDGLYLESDKKKYFRDLAQVLGSHLKRKKGFFARFPRWGWVFSNPVTDRNRQNIMECFQTAIQQKQMALVLAGCLVVNDYDCQVKNIAFCKENDKEVESIAKFDDGWGLAEIGRPENHKVDLFKKLPWYGDRATHKGAFVPTNHFIDYAYLLHTQEFADALTRVANMALINAENSTEKALQTIDKAHEANPELNISANPAGHLKAYQDLAAHLGMKVTDNNIAAIRQAIKQQLTTVLKSRAESMLILSAALNLKIQIDNAPHMAIDATHSSYIQLVALLKKHEQPEGWLPDFSNAPKPFSQSKEVEQRYTQLMNKIVAQAKKARLQDSSTLNTSTLDTSTLDTSPVQKTILPPPIVLGTPPRYSPFSPGIRQGQTTPIPSTAKVMPQANGTTAYLMESNVKASEQEAVIIALCEKAIKDGLDHQVAAPMTLSPLEFNLQDSPLEQKEFIQKTLVRLIEQNQQHYDDHNPAPIIKDGNKILYTLNTNPPSTNPTPRNFGK